MPPRTLFTAIGLCFLYFPQINGDLSRCKYYLNQHGTPYPLDICTAQSIKGVVTSTKTVCDSQTTSLFHQTFSGFDCSASNLQSEETWTNDRFNLAVCTGDDCAVSFRAHSDHTCDSDFTDLAFVRGVVYKEPSEQSHAHCTMYECASDLEKDDTSVDITEMDCKTHSPYMERILFSSHDNCDISPLHCGSATSRSTYAQFGGIQTTTTPNLNSGALESNRIYTLPAIPVASFCFTIVLLVLLSLIYFLYCGAEAEKEMLSPIKVFVILSIGCNVFAIICILIVCILMQIMAWNDDLYHLALIPYIGSVIGYVGGKFCLESFFLLRVYTAFQGSVFQMSTRMCCVLLIWMILISSMWLVTLIVNDKSMHFGFIVIWALESIFIVTLLGIFVKGLQQLLIESSLEKVTASPAVSSTGSTLSFPRRKPTDSSSVSVSVAPSIKEDVVDTGTSMEARISTLSALESVSSVRKWEYICCMMRAYVRTTKVNISLERLPLIYLMTRCVVLSSVSLLTTAVFGIFLSIQTTIDVQCVYILYSIWSIDITINSCCLFLNFRFSDVFYKKGCMLCHRSCRNMLEYISASHIVHNEAVKSLSDLRTVNS